MQKQDEERTSNVERDEWSAKNLSEESSNKDSDEIMREMRRGGAENAEDADDRDAVGRVDSNETWQGREEAQTRTEKYKEQQGDSSSDG